MPTTKKNKSITYQTNCVVGDYHYFRSHSQFLIGRVHLTTGRVEYLQVPVQIVRDQSNDQPLWDKALPNEVKNVDGFIVYQDKCATGNGWGHVSAASPIVVRDFLFMPTMIGTVYVLKWNMIELNEKALVSVSDLGPAQKTWTLSSLSYANEKLYARTLTELLCLAPSDDKLPNE